MSLSINQNIMAMNSYRNLSVTQGGLAKSLEKLSSGFRINRAADDAAGLAISEGLRSQVGGNRQAVRNAQDGISVIQTAEGALNEVHSILQRMRVLAVQGANDSNDSKSRGNINAELKQLRSELDRIGNVTNFNGTKLLDGSASGSSAMRFQVGANGTNNDRIVVDLKDADVTKIAQFGGKAEISNVKSGETAQLDKGKYKLHIEGKVLDIDLSGAKAAKATEAEVTSAVEKAIKDSGFNGYIGKPVPSVTSEALANVDANTSLKDTTFTLKIGDNSVSYKVTDDSGTVEEAIDMLQAQLKEKGLDTKYQIGIEKTGANKGKVTVKTLDENSPQAKVSLTVDKETVKVGAAANKNLLEGKIGAPAGNGIKFSADGGKLKIERVDGKNLDIDLEHSLSKANADPGKPGTDVPFATIVKADANGGNYVSKDVNYLTVEDHDSAQNLINVLDDKINSVSTARANLGAIQNRFEHTITNLNVAVENLAASESRIRDTDMAQEMMQFTRNQILSQAGTSMLAQANQVPQGVLSLLR
ncbi:flagellin N-terminal helical domain-containing protein [Mobiluncus mulieris]|uniref:flagellin N-terminal helical domain-containing protein n=1 Tax=Mobiluncus mulieris TaxID=2052 RepID=UPI001B8C42F7|nr:flagellin [Mobiluncus mulieris]